MRTQHFRPSALLLALCLVLALGATQGLADAPKSPSEITFQGKTVKERAPVVWNFSGFERFFRLAQKYAHPVFPVLFAPAVDTSPGELDQAGYFVLGKPKDPSESDRLTIIDHPDPY